MNTSLLTTIERRLQLCPLLRVALCMLAGILLAEAIQSVMDVWGWLSALAGVLLAAAVLRRIPMCQTLLVLLAWVCVGGVADRWHARRLEVPYVAGAVAYEGVVLTEPVQHGKVMRFDLFVVGGSYTGCRLKASLLRDTVQQRYLRLHIGDGFRAQSVVEPPQNSASSRFDYARYLRVHGFVGTTFIYYKHWQKASVSLDAMPAADRLRLRMMIWRQHLLGRMRGMVSDDDTAALLAAMTLGYKHGLSAPLREVYQSTGVSHVLALSGLHLGIIYLLLTHLFPTRRKEWLRQTLLLLAIWSYVVLVGMSMSVVRAAVMISVYAIVRLLRREGQPINTLSLATIVLMMANPLCIYDVGFQLSFVAVGFILLFFNPVYRLLPDRWLTRSRLLRWLWSMIAVSLVAGIGVAPLIAHHFGTFAPYFLLANLIAVPAATLLIYGTLLLLLLTPLPAAQAWVADALAQLSHLSTQSLSAIAALPHATVSHLSLTSAQTALIYAMIFLAAAMIAVMRRGMMHP